MKRLLVLLFTIFIFSIPSLVFGAIINSTDWEDGDISPTPWGEHLEGGTAAVTTTGTYAGSTYSAEFTLTADHRAEIQIAPPSAVGYDWGTEYWVGFAMNVTSSIDWYGYINQHHSTPNGIDWNCGGGTNGFTIFEEDGDIYFTGSTNSAFVYVQPTAPGADWEEVIYHQEAIQYNHWYEVVLHFQYEPDATGFFQIWLDGTQIADWEGVTTYAIDRCGLARYETNYQKLGVYAADGSDGQVRYDNFKVADSAGSYNIVHPNGGADTTPPVLSNPLPTGQLSSGTTGTTISVDATDATGVTGCKYDTTDIAYASMTGTLAFDAGTTWDDAITGLTDGNDYTYYARCTDGTYPNTTSETISFSVEETPAVGQSSVGIGKSTVGLQRSVVH